MTRADWVFLDARHLDGVCSGAHVDLTAATRDGKYHIGGSPSLAYPVQASERYAVLISERGPSGPSVLLHIGVGD